MKNRLNKLYADNRKAAARKFEVVAKADSSEVDIFLYDNIVSSEDEAEWWGGVAPESFVKAVYAVDPSHTINLRVNSPGGSVFAARAMEQALRAHKGKVVVHIDGIAASAATFVSMAGDEVVMAKGAMFMIHKAWTGMWGNAEDLRKEADLLDKIDGTLADTYAEKTGKDVAAISEWMAAETWFTAQEALDAGFATSIAEAEAKAGAWNLSAYDNAPKAERAPAPMPEPAPEPEDAMASEDHRKRQAQRLRVLSLLNQ
jgi:ATP-dependent Clp protease protease subunit